MDYSKSFKKESPFLNVMGMGGGVSSLLTLASGELTYIDDVFSTFLWDGTGSAHTITNGIDVSGEGGLVWIKSRTHNSASHCLYDTERGAGDVIFSNSDSAEAADLSLLSAFTSSGFSLGSGTPAVNQSGDDYCSWTFRKCPGFFDVVTFTSNNSSSGVSVSHSLGSTPGMIIVKSYSDSSTDWWVWHNSSPVDSSSPPSGVPAGSRKIGKLNDLGSFTGSTNIINSVTSTSFNYGNNGAGYNDDTNTNFVAYVFAHNDGSFGEDSDEAVIKCGGYTGNGTNGHEINVGFEPQYVLIKNSGDNGNWFIMDVMRGAPMLKGSTDGRWLSPNRNWNESTLQNYAVWPTPTGFKIWNTGGSFNGNTETYVYMAIRRSHKPPEAGTEVFAIDVKTAKSDNTPQYTSGFPVDLLIRRNQIDSSDYPEFQTRLTSRINYISEVGTGWGETGTLTNQFDFNNGVYDGSSARATDYHWMFKRARGFLDVLSYAGTGSSGLTVNHNLGTTPELLIYKNRTSTGTNWFVITESQYGNLNNSNAFSSQSFISFGSSSYTINTTGNSTNASGEEYIAYLFGSVDGVSKIGSYSGSSSDVNVDCGFTSGARFVLIKRTDAIGDWCLFDTSRGIVSGNDTRLVLNGASAQDNGNDLIDPLSSGFTVVGGNSSINGDSRTYLFLAIA